MIAFHTQTEFEISQPEIHAQWLKNCIENEGKELGEINIIFCSDEQLLSVNQEYLSHDYYTDIITFDYTQENEISGDLFISIERVQDNANEYNVSTLHELCRVMVHGVLHLLEYKDKTSEQQTLMRQKEEEYLSLHPEM